MQLSKKDSMKLVSLLICLLGVSLFLFIPNGKVFSLHSSYFDLGIFHNIFYRMSMESEWQLAFSGHAHWFAFLYSFFYGILPLSAAPYFLVTSQAIFLLLPGFLFYRHFGIFPAFVYFTFFPIWMIAHFDFHFDHLAVPITMCFYLALLHRRVGLAVLSATMLMFVKEPFALQTAACGILMFLASLPGSSICFQSEGKNSSIYLMVGGVWLFFSGLVYFVFAMYYLLPFFAPVGWEGALGTEAYGWLGTDLRSVLQTIITNPLLVALDIISTPAKLMYLAVVLGVLAFIPLLRPVFLIPAIPIFSIAMLSQLQNHYDYNSHYTAGLIIPAMFAFVHGLPRAEEVWGKALSLAKKSILVFRRWLPSMVFVIKTSSRGEDTVSADEDRRRVFYVLLIFWVLIWHAMLTPSPISRLFWSDKVWSYRWQAYLPTERNAMIKNAIENFVPTGEDVPVTTQNTLNYGPIGSRKIYLPFPLGIADVHNTVDWSSRTVNDFWFFLLTGYKPVLLTNNHYSEYIILDLKRPYFLIDRGCEWVYSECRDEEMERKFIEWLSIAQMSYHKVFDQDGFMILRRCLICD